VDEFLFKKKPLGGTSSDDILYNSTGTGSLYGGFGNDKFHIAVNDAAHMFVDGGRGYDVIKIYERPEDVISSIEYHGGNTMIFYEDGQVIVARSVEKIVFDAEGWEFS